MQLTVVTGLSGSGKTQVVRFLEDLGFFCIDNMPPALIEKIADMFLLGEGKNDKIAFVVDMRVGAMINQLTDTLAELKKSGYGCKLLFLDASDEVLVKRYKETRRTHPIVSENGLLGSIREERRRLARLKNEADYVIDTSSLSISGLMGKLREIFVRDAGVERTMTVNVMAFGFKYGIPVDADLVFDVRCFPNPFYVEGLKSKTGNEKAVQDYVMSFQSAKDFMQKLNDMMYFLLPLYAEERKPSVTIAIGCTGGKHRSVTMANELGSALETKNYKINMIYRDIEK